MWKNNRPDDWEEIKKTTIPHLARFDGGVDQYIAGYETGVETGADAMLEALKKGGVEYHTWMGREASNVAQYVQQTGGIPEEGWLVFIPEK